MTKTIPEAKLITKASIAFNAAINLACFLRDMTLTIAAIVFMIAVSKGGCEIHHGATGDTLKFEVKK